MKKMMRLAGVLSLAALAGGAMIAAGGRPPAPALTQPAAAEGAFTVDTVHSAVMYRIKHLNVAYNYGRFDTFSGTFLIDRENPANSAISLTVQTESVDSDNSKRDDHLRSQDFFSVKEFPTATFVSKSAKKTGENTYEFAGDFTLLGKTLPITVTVEDTGRGPGRQGGEVAGIETRFTFSRSAHGMTYMAGKGLADEVTMIVSLEGGRK